jgi:hypothetical protein
MMNRKMIAMILTLMILPALAYQARAGVVRLKIANNGFETTADTGIPAYWQREIKEAVLPGITIKTDRYTGYESTASLLMFHEQEGQSTLLSSPLSLKVGCLYRLSARIKTVGAVTDPVDRYPTSVAACLTMVSFPFTNHSPTVGGDTEWQEISAIFVATEPEDRIRLHFGFNGKAKGKAWFDNIGLEEISDITAYIPMETVRWFGPGFRYDDRGWIFVHIEGKPYPRGYQYGYLLAEEIVSYIEKLAYEEDNNDPQTGWEQLRRFTDATMLRKYDKEYLEEMKGIADGAAKNSAEYKGEPLDLIDIVTLNSVIDIGQVSGALRRTGHALSGANFLKTEDELNIPLKQHKCSGFVANGPATKNGEIVFGQIFMWGGYTGVHWNVICDVVPEKGNRLVYETFPGGIHSGADMYVNGAGIMIGETTVSQTPFDAGGTPQSNRIRKAAQYANSIDDVVRILKFKNNGMYTNDWLIGDAKTNEGAIFLLGTKKSKLWRSSSGYFPGGTTGFFWSNNNNKDPEVRKEYIPNADNAPYDLIFSPWNRDIAFNRFFREQKGKIDAAAGVNLWASSPINRAHACDGKITTTAMAKNLMFLAHFGKVTLREKFPFKDNRILRDYPKATPHLSLGYSVVSPKIVAEKLQVLKKAEKQKKTACEKEKNEKNDLSGVKGIYEFCPRTLWHNTVYPASNRENWFVSGTAAYWKLLKKIPDSQEKSLPYISDYLAGLNNILLYTISREEAIAPLEAKRLYDRYNHYKIPTIRGTFLLHQLRLYMGNSLFSKFMNHVHRRFKERPMTTEDFLSAAEKITKKSLKPFVMQWLARKDLPHPGVKIIAARKTVAEWQIDLLVSQPVNPYHFFTTVAVETGKGAFRRLVEIKGSEIRVSLRVPHKPVRVIFNAGNDIPVTRENFYTWSNFYDDFHHTKIVYGTSRQIEANHTLALRFQTALADRYSEILPPVRKDSEISAEELANSDLIILGGSADNGSSERIALKAGLILKKNMFQWQGKTYGRWDDGIYLVIPNPYNPRKVAYIIIANSALQLYHMTKKVYELPSLAIFKKDKIVETGCHPVKRFNLDIGAKGEL